MKKEDQERLIEVTVVPKSSRPGVERTGPGCYRVRVGSPPRQGRANRELKERMAGYLGVPKSSIEIVRGGRTKKKFLKVRY